jgi:hypothetical protein
VTTIPAPETTTVPGTAVTLGGQGAAITALASLRAAMPHLPAAVIGLSDIWLDLLDVSFHPRDDDPTSSALAAFEAWRAALGVTTDAIECRQTPGAAFMTLRATIRWGGAEVRLTEATDGGEAT